MFTQWLARLFERNQKETAEQAPFNLLVQEGTHAQWDAATGTLRIGYEDARDKFLHSLTDPAQIDIKTLSTMVSTLVNARPDAQDARTALITSLVRDYKAALHQEQKMDSAKDHACHSKCGCTAPGKTANQDPAYEAVVTRHSTRIVNGKTMEDRSAHAELRGGQWTQTVTDHLAGPRPESLAL